MWHLLLMWKPPCSMPGKMTACAYHLGWPEQWAFFLPRAQAMQQLTPKNAPHMGVEDAAATPAVDRLLTNGIFDCDLISVHAHAHNSITFSLLGMLCILTASLSFLMHQAIDGQGFDFDGAVFWHSACQLLYKPDRCACLNITVSCLLACH